MSFQSEALAAVMNIYCIRPCKIAPGKTEIMNSVQQVGFAHAIASANSHDPLTKVKRPGAVIFKLKE